MSAVYNPEAETVATIERLELDARDLRRRLERCRNEEDRRVLNRLLQEAQEDIERLQRRVS